MDGLDLVGEMAFGVAGLGFWGDFTTGLNSFTGELGFTEGLGVIDGELGCIEGLGFFAGEPSLTADLAGDLVLFLTALSFLGCSASPEVMMGAGRFRRLYLCRLGAISAGYKEEEEEPLSSTEGF